MIPILYSKNSVDFYNNGIGHLKDTISCKVKEERNGDYVITLQYPITGAWYSRIVEGSIIKAKANDTSDLQLFRVYKSSKPLKGVVTFYAEHISYDLKGLPLASLSMSDTSAEVALNTGFDSSMLPHSFTAWSDISTLNDIEITKPRSLRNLCGGEAGSVLSIWGGEFEFDNYLVKLHKKRGANRGVIINYGKNLTDAKQERNISACYTHFCPYAIKKTETTNESGEVVETSEETIMLSEGVIELVNPENIGHTRALTLDISDKFSEGEEISENSLRIHAEEYIKSHKLGVPVVNITLSFMQIWNSPEYSKIANFERVSICDTVTVRFSDLGIDAEAKIIKTEYDTLEERFTKLEIGDARSTLADTFSSLKETITDTQKSLADNEKTASSTLQKAIENATNRITGNSGGHVVLYPPNYPQEILIMNTPDKDTATKVWRFNSSGFGYSSTGYNGEFGIAATMDGAIVADFITTGTLKAINISGCTITGGSLNISDKFKVDTQGNIRAEGEIIALSGNIGGCIINSGKLEIPIANITGTLTASHIDASELKVSAANIVGSLTIGQLPETLAEKNDIPTKVSELTNDSQYQTESGVVTIINGKITADYVQALGITVDAAKIKGTLTASQIDAADLKVSAANIIGSLTIGQLPETLAEKTDVPTKVSELTNDSQYQTESGVVTIINGKITADYVQALGITVDAAKIKGTLTSSQIDAADLKVSAANITGKLTADQINADGISAKDVDITGEITAITEDSAISLADGMIKIVSPVIADGLHYYVPLFEFDFGGEKRYIVVDYYNREQWKIHVASGTFLNPNFGTSTGGGTITI